MKIRTLRNIKTEALLIYIKTLCQECVDKLEKSEYVLDLGDKTSNNEINEAIAFLRESLDKTIFNAYEFKAYINIYNKKNPNSELGVDHKALIYYYNNIILEFEKSFKKGDKWIPEQIIFALLSEWVLEENNSTIKEYEFLEKIDYIKLLSYFEITRNSDGDEDEELKKSVMSMFKIATGVIKRLKSLKFRVNNKRKSKTRK